MFSQCVCSRVASRQSSVYSLAIKWCRQWLLVSFIILQLTLISLLLYYNSITSLAIYLCLPTALPAASSTKSTGNQHLGANALTTAAHTGLFQLSTLYQLRADHILTIIHVSCTLLYVFLYSSTNASSWLRL